MAPAADFARRTGQPILVGEYGGMRFVPDMGDYVSDVVSLFEEHGFSHTYYNWGKDPGWDVDAFNLQYGPNSSNHELAPASSTFRPILDSWRKNKGSRQELSPLDDITSFAYVLDNVEANLDAMAKSGYDMLVVDNVRSVMDTTGYNMAKAVRKLKSSHSASGGHKIVVAYINIGEAEDYRWYWQDSWRVGNPDWIEVEDPDGWDGNYPVNFWHPKWKAVIYDYIDMIAADGFDGLYLDWIEAYDVDQVANAADAERKDAKKEMIRFVCEIYRKARESGMYVIAQNAAELGAYPEYLSCLDGEGQEAIWFDGSGDPDHGKEGDAKTDPEDTSYYIKALRQFQNAGLPVFSIDYAEEQHTANEVYHNARAQGYISYVTIRSLSALSGTPPAGLED